MTRPRSSFPTAMTLVVCACMTSLAIAQRADQTVDETHWQQRLPELDRQLLDALIGQPLPAITPDVRWLGVPAADNAQSLDDLRNKVIVIQSFSTAQRGTVAMPARVHKIFEDHPQRDNIQLIALHTPEGHDNAQQFLERKPAPIPVLLDTTGVFSDSLGVYKRPVNIIVDRHGVVRYAGLDLRRGLVPAVEKLIAEPYNPTPAAKADDADKTSDAEPDAADPVVPRADWPPTTGSVGAAADLRGRSAPKFHVEQWITPQPELDPTKVVIIDFWATWCKPCIAAIPHMNSIADTFADDVLVVGISSEDRARFEQGAEKAGLRPTTFRYAIAIDPSRAMSTVAAVQGIPHIMVISSDWTVRWQGHPSQLSEGIVRQIVAANKYHNQKRPATRPTSGQPPTRNRWNPGN